MKAVTCLEAVSQSYILLLLASVSTMLWSWLTCPSAQLFIFCHVSHDSLFKNLQSLHTLYAGKRLVIDDWWFVFGSFTVILSSKQLYRLLGLFALTELLVIIGVNWQWYVLGWQLLASIGPSSGTRWVSKAGYSCWKQVWCSRIQQHGCAYLKIIPVNILFLKLLITLSCLARVL